jgi:hypothetical protein
MKISLEENLNLIILDLRTSRTSHKDKKKEEFHLCKSW